MKLFFSLPEEVAQRQVQPSTGRPGLWASLLEKQKTAVQCHECHDKKDANGVS